MASYSGENSYGHEKAEFSPEIFDYILSFLDVEDADERRALAQCLLVSRAFCSLSRYHLFAKVTIKDGGVDDGEIKQGSKLLQVLKNDPLHDIHPLALQVRSLEVSFSDATRTFNWIGEPSLWRDTLHKSLPAILDVLQNLQAFQLRFEQAMNWKELGKFLHDSLTRLFASPRLTSVCISKVYNFRPEILCCPNLGELRLDSVWVKSFFVSERQLSCLPPLTWSITASVICTLLSTVFDDVLGELGRQRRWAY
ncbi:hypothetical protein CPB84DRAFT_1847846 [Gymnopilus junonius]|uniref:F-box protein n=1 Tax=Gymnopilus junonius TaxID=109634 RepID=A0A9P5TLG9_GYMJU|nr:hypothetical protein CPB84DRAFT_1847846 [Gymnopilus junonius]